MYALKLTPLPERIPKHSLVRMAEEGLEPPTKRL